MNLNEKKHKIIAIDDTSFICQTLAAWLKSRYDVETFSSGKAAMNYLNDVDNKADLILLDYDMPEMTGYEVLMAIRTGKYFSKVPVIFLTGEPNERMKTEMLERGANDYINKPLDMKILFDRIEKLLN
jgi:PleD family two-component response regulator